MDSYLTQVENSAMKTAKLSLVFRAISESKKQAREARLEEIEHRVQQRLNQGPINKENEVRFYEKS